MLKIDGSDYDTLLYNTSEEVGQAVSHRRDVLEAKDFRSQPHAGDEFVLFYIMISLSRVRHHLL